MLIPPLRTWRPSDAESLAFHANNPSVARWLRDRFPHPYTRADAEAWISRVDLMVPPVAFAIAVDDVAIGGIGLEIGSDVHRFSAEVGYWVGEAHWGRGLATAALRAITQHAFEELNLLRVFALPFESNRASARVLEKAGYLREGVLRRSVFKNGQVLDMALYAITRDG